MCITKVASYEFGGKLYPTELEAVRAALTEIGTKIVKEHASAPHAGLIDKRADLIPLLTRYDELTAPTDAPTEPTSEKAVPPFQEIVDAFQGRSIEDAHDYIAKCGHPSIDDFLAMASSKQIHQLEEILGLRDDGDE